MEMINSKEIIANKKAQLIDIVKGFNSAPKLCIIQVEGDKASDRYVSNKKKLGAEIGIDVEHILLDSNIALDDLLAIIDSNNSDSSVNGIIVQLPLPEHLDKHKRLILDSICPYKDVDGLGAYQIGWLGTNDKRALAPCTAKGVVTLLDNVVEDGLVGKDICIVNCSHLIGIPLQTMLRDIATVTVCHKLTNGLKNKMKSADIVITGIGSAKYFDRSYVSNNQVIIDCSMNITEQEKLEIQKALIGYQKALKALHFRGFFIFVQERE
jgi:methylenetetrahydrofolate dehydrogenase (NADP+)/methenyltetrahydrofolate cyclohydrolase